jgi:hypothetical protein
VAWKNEGAMPISGAMKRVEFGLALRFSIKKGDRKMKFSKLAFVVAFVLTAILFAEVAVHAEEADQSTKLTFSAPVAIPGQILPAGTYLFKLASKDNLDLVQIFNANGTHLYASVETVAAERMEPTGDTVVTLAKQTNGPAALVKWFYPGNTFGHEFVYSKQEQQLAQDRQQTISVKETAQAGD